VHAVLADFVAGCRYDSAAGNAANDERFSDETWVVTLFDRRIESVHVDVENSAGHGKGVPLR